MDACVRACMCETPLLISLSISIQTAILKLCPFFFMFLSGDTVLRFQSML